MVKSQILCTWIVGLEPFSIFAVSFGLCLASNCVPFFVFNSFIQQNLAFYVTCFQAGLQANSVLLSVT